MPAHKRLIQDRFWEKVDKTPGHGPNGDCWVFTGYRDKNGYGTLQKEGGTGLHKAHRLSFEWHFGVIPAGAHICHHCDNPSCVNPAHLYAGSALSNTIDRKVHGKGFGQNSGERQGAAKLSDRQAYQVRAFYGTGAATMQELADIFGVRNSSIWRVVNGIGFKTPPVPRSKRGRSRKYPLAPV